MQWEDNESHVVRTVEQLDRMLEQVGTSHDDNNPVLVQIRSPTGAIMMVGIGGELSVIDHIPASGWPAQHSVGNPTDETIPYRLGSHDSPMPKAYAIRRELARKAIEYFYRTEQLLNDITWEND